ncbi:MAG: hypothetical protein JWN70_6052 [Planctomycetaceae bacterium]|nr:hypothetical protein [Planctomycetaceae bacterium]
MLLTPIDFASDWGVSDLVRLQMVADPADLPASELTFLATTGLPALIRYSPGVSEAVVTFCRLRRGVTKAIDEPIVGGPLSSEWDHYWVIGDEYFCNGSAWWCINAVTGTLERIDIELDHPILFVNTSIRHFASALVVALNCVSHGDTVEEWRSRLAHLEAKLVELDPQIVIHSRSFWRSYLDFIRDEQPRKCPIERGSLEQGNQALQNGPW